MPEIFLEGSVGAAFWPEDPHFTAASVRAALSGQQDVTINLNSGGGIANEGLAIYHTLKSHPGQVHIVVTAVAGSAASLLLMAADRISMKPGAMVMVHDPAVGWTEGRGTEDDHRAVADMLSRMSDGYAAIYAARAGISTEDAREIMRAETWMTAEEAVEAGFADDIADGQAVAAAAFPYRIYANAPQHLLLGSRADGPEKRAVLAIMCGVAAPLKKENSMRTKAAATLAQDTIEGGEDTALEGGEDTTIEDGEDTAIEDGEDTIDGADVEGDDAGEDDGDDAVAILDLVAMHGGTVTTARNFIATQTPLARVVAHYREKGPTVTKHKPGGPTARITRDEVDTRRIGMTEALAAQFGRRAPADDRARPFMSMTLAQMAALSIGHKGSLREPGDRMNVFMSMHTTSDFPLSLQNALNKELESRYTVAEPTYRRLARQKSFNDFRPHPIVRAGDFPALQAIGEGGEIKFGTLGEKSESVVLRPYGVGLSISRQTLINDDIGAIADMIADQGVAVAQFEDATFYAMMLGGANADGPTLTETTRQMFNTTDVTKAGTAAVINLATLSIGRAALMKKTSLSGRKLAIQPAILLVGPDKLTEAQQIVAPIQADQAGNWNPFSGKIEVIATAEITGNAWYLFADPALGANFVYGYLQGAGAPRTRMEELFGYQGMRLTVEHDFGCGASDFRFGWKNAGA